MTPSKIRTNVYLDSELKEQAKKLFKEYGMSFSDGINILLRKVVKEREFPIPNELDIEPIHPDDPDYKALMDAQKSRKDENYASMDEIDWD